MSGRLGRLPGRLLRLEGAALAAASIAVYAHESHSWLVFALLALAPDLSAAGYLIGPTAGTVAYDLAHTTTVPLALGVVGVLVDSDASVAVALVWLTHIGADRALGYGLKYSGRRADTHLQRVAPASDHDAAAAGAERP